MNNPWIIKTKSNKTTLLLLIVFSLLLSMFLGCDLFEKEKYTLVIGINEEDAGSVRREPDHKEYIESTIVKLTAVPNDGWEFDYWQGDAEGTDPTIEITMDGNKEINAMFKQKEFSLTVDTQGQGTVSIDPEQETYFHGEEVTLDPVPKKGWLFSHWEGDLSDKDTPAIITMDRDKTITAVFVKKEYQLSLNTTGQGTVDAEPQQDLYEHGTIVTLTASPDTGWEFDHWQGDAKGSEPTIEITMDGDKEITAVFKQKEFTLTVDTQGQGSVSVEPEKETYFFGQEVVLDPIPDQGWAFSHWEDDLSGKDTPAIITMDRDKSITAVFVKKEYQLSLNTTGQGTVDAEPQQDLYEHGTIVTLTASPDTGWEFDHWQGDAKGTETNIEITMDGDKEITAFFKQKEFTLTVDTQGQGSVSVEPEKETYFFCQEVNLTAIPEENWNFYQWAGDASGNEKTLTLIIKQDTKVRAIFGEYYQVTGEISIKHNWPASAVEDISPKSNGLKLPSRKLDTGFFDDLYKPGQIIIKFHPLTAQSEKKSVFQNMNLEILDRIDYLNAYLVKTPSFDIQSDIFSVKSFPSVVYAEPNYIARALTNLPNDEHYSFQWHYPQIRLPQAWNITTGSSQVRIAVLDTGVDTGHPDLGTNVDTDAGYNFVDNNTDTNDRHGHGTHVAGTIGADTNNNLGVAGVMWECSIIPVKVLNDGGIGSFWGIAQGILYAAGLTEDPSICEPAQIINLSLGGSFNNSTLQNAVQAAADSGLIMVGASGNNNGSILYPALYPEVIAVGAVDYNYPDAPQRAPYSNYGSELDIVAPGGDSNVDSDGDGYVDGVLSASFDKNGTKDYVYRFSTGTSMATPHVTGVIGLMLAEGIPAYRIREIITKTSIDLGTTGFNSYYGHGLINAYWAVNDVQHIRILVGNRIGNKIEAVKEKKIDLRATNYSIDNIPPGEYRVYAWIDVQDNNIIEAGDYLAQTEKIVFDEMGTLNKDLVLTEKNN